MHSLDILFVDDDTDILHLVEQFLSRQGYAITVVDNGLTALEMVRERGFDIVFTDFKMPQFTGLELLTAIKKYRPETEVIIVTGHGTMESAITAMKYGSYDYLQKPFRLELLKIIVDKIQEEKKLKQENIRLKKRLKERHRFGDLLGISLKMREIYDLIDGMHPMGPAVLVQGEIGSGKELLARVIHKHSQRREHPFVPVNCKIADSQIPAGRLADHLAGLFETVGQGTLFLDEINDLSQELQVRFLEKIAPPIPASGGAVVDIPTAPRIIAATCKDLDEALDNQTLGQAFYDHVREVIVRVPPLRDRKEDISLLILHFLHKYNRSNRNQIASIAPRALDVLMSYHWPGNVIQLENVIERAFALGEDKTIDLEALPSEIRTFGEVMAGG